MQANKKASLGQVGKAAPVRRVAMPVRASAQDIGMLIAAAAEEAVKPGSVDAPIGEQQHNSASHSASMVVKRNVK